MDTPTECFFWKRQKNRDADEDIGGGYLASEDDDDRYEHEDDQDPPCEKCDACLLSLDKSLEGVPVTEDDFPDYVRDRIIMVTSVFSVRSNMHTVEDAIKAQEKLCQEKKLPHFAPRNGVCWSCQRNIYEGEQSEDGSTFITGCWRCHRSYCD